MKKISLENGKLFKRKLLLLLMGFQVGIDHKTAKAIQDIAEIAKTNKKLSIKDKLPKKEIEILTKIYIAQNIRTEGVLKKQFHDEETINELINKSLIQIGQWYKYEVLFTTYKGNKIAKERISKRIEEEKEEIKEF